MSVTALSAVSPVDGRYHRLTLELAPYFSEAALMEYRVRIEIEYFIALCELPLPQLEGFNPADYSKLRDISERFHEHDAREIKEIEKTTNHDVKAVEYYLKGKFDELGLEEYKEFIHFGLTSQDINNTAVPLMLKGAIEKIYMAYLHELTGKLGELSEEWNGVTMMAKTHGQPASPTRLGKELAVFTERIEQQLQLLQHIPYSAKFGGATGNFNAHLAAYPHINWIEFANNLVNNVLGLQRSQLTTQIEHYDNLAAHCDCFKRINNILLDLNRDMWTYISMNYFKQRIKQGEVGSSAMPHKVNPIDFENSEGNLGIANALFEHFAAKLPVSRLQRDLTDSTVLRNLGVPLAHTLIALKSTLKGLSKLVLNKEAIDQDLDNNWSVVAEAIQTVLRREGYPRPYETLKDLTRKNGAVGREEIHSFIDGLQLKDQVKTELKNFSPHNYTGY
ncbi:adenylosuccinate lyase [Anseongella ginsenosidimutans]|uniref:Adenylosuccinate lyase n=1 Tax=Anseongella ginsenosidimutans TaxID=496056 RepID=A0A4R3KRA0_9SPHI|nr:adenylosuccinate lyase [Anseongella ginsenosidimutans]QEC53644.1 adenylosuccinate lyase [Anseongella ginsenosidimutans]TCS86108.1 adenylosuccinate lyase [Anseongella ginsenosidimutans]